VSNRQNDKDGWSSDSASLFRAARRAHDPTALERARLDAVLARIQAGHADVSKAASGAPIAARGVTAAVLRQVAKVSLAVVCVAVVSLVVLRANRQASRPAPSEQPAPTATTTSPMPDALPPAPSPSAERRELARTPEARERGESHSRSQRRQERANAAKQRASKLDVASVAEADVSAAGDGFTGVTAPPNDAPQDGRSGPEAAANANPTTAGGVAQRANSFESNPRAEEIPAARTVDPQPSQKGNSELAMLKRMQAALREADFSTALALCGEHQQRWPHGAFELEREGVRAIAACGADSAGASRRAKAFLAAHPHAPVAMRVSSACASQLTKR
jgi:hypothetical protein